MERRQYQSSKRIRDENVSYFIEITRRIIQVLDYNSYFCLEDGKLYSAGHVFCNAQVEDNMITIGHSSGSKMWRSAYMSIPENIRWCDFNGKKIVNSMITLKGKG